MKKENANLLLGLGVGALLGVAIGYLMTEENRKKTVENLNEVGQGIKDGVEAAFAKAKERAGEYCSRMTGNEQPENIEG